MLLISHAACTCNATTSAALLHLGNAVQCGRGVDSIEIHRLKLNDRKKLAKRARSSQLHIYSYVVLPHAAAGLSLLAQSAIACPGAASVGSMPLAGQPRAPLGALAACTRQRDWLLCWLLPGPRRRPEHELLGSGEPLTVVGCRCGGADRAAQSSVPQIFTMTESPGASGERAQRCPESHHMATRRVNSSSDSGNPVQDLDDAKLTRRESCYDAGTILVDAWCHDKEHHQCNVSNCARSHSRLIPPGLQAAFLRQHAICAAW